MVELPTQALPLQDPLLQVRAWLLIITGKCIQKHNKLEFPDGLPVDKLENWLS